MTGSTIKVYTDEDVDVDLASNLRSKGYDIISTRDAGNAHQGFDDEWQLRYATAQGRALFIHNIDDYVKLDHVWTAQGREHCGIIISDRKHIGELIRRMAAHIDTVSLATQHNTILFLNS